MKLKRKTRNRICFALLTAFLLTLVIGRYTGAPAEEVFYVEKTLVSASYITTPGMMIDYSAALLSHDGNFYECKYFSDTSIALTDEKVDDALENLLGDQIGYVYGNHDLYWATYQDELDEVTDIGLIYEVKGYDVSEAVAVLFDNYPSAIDSTQEGESEIFRMSETTPVEANGRNLYLFRAYDTDAGEEI